MAEISDALTYIRHALRDYPRMNQADIAGDGMATLFHLPVPTVNGETMVVTLQTPSLPTTLVKDDDYTVYERDGQVLLNIAPPTVDDVLYFEFEYWEWFTDSQLSHYIGVTVAELETDASFVFADVVVPSPQLELVAAGAIVEALWALLNETARDIDLRNPEGVDLPVSQRFSQLERMLARWTAKYEDLASVLNVGLHRIEMFTLRRVSRTTGRLVPVYTPQEIDDTTRPDRVYPPIDPQVN